MSATLKSLMSKKAAPTGWSVFLDALRAGDKTELKRIGAEPVSKASNQVGSSGILGGYAVPLDYNLAIATTYEENAFFYPRATVVPMLSRETILPVPNATTAQSAGVAPWFGGLIYGWGTGGTGTIPQTNPTLAQVRFTAHSLIGTITVSNDLAQDIGPGGDEFLFTMFARGAAYYEEYAFFNGEPITVGGGSVLNQPLGILKSNALKQVTRAFANQITTADVANVAAGMTPLGWTKAIWVCSPSALGQIAKLTGFVPNQQNGFDTDHVSAAGSLLGRPLFVSDKVPILGTLGDLGFYDPSQYVIGDRAELIISIGDEVPGAFNTNQTVYRVWRRVDGKPIYTSPITLTNGTTTVSPFVGLL